jgi:hypothetical protein
MEQNVRHQVVGQLSNLIQKESEDQALKMSSSNFLGEVLNTINTEKDQQIRMTCLKELIVGQENEVLVNALKEIPVVKNGQQKQELLLVLVPLFPAEVISRQADLIFAAIESFAWHSDSAIILHKLAAYLPVDAIANSARLIMKKAEKNRYRLDEAQEWSRIAYRFGQMAVILPKDVFETILDQVPKIDFYSGPDDNEQETADAFSGRLIIQVIGDLGEHCPPGLLLKCLKLCRIFADDRDRAWVAGYLTENLPTDLIGEGLGLVRSDVFLYPQTARVVLDHLSEKLSLLQLEEAIGVAEQIGDEKLVSKLKSLRYS